MSRVKRGFKARRRRNRILKLASGYWGARSRLFETAIAAVHKAWVYGYKHRKERKRDFRRLWITRINSAARLNGVTYGRLVEALKRGHVELDRKVLADIAVRDPATFKAVVDFARSKTA